MQMSSRAPTSTEASLTIYLPVPWVWIERVAVHFSHKASAPTVHTVCLDASSCPYFYLYFKFSRVAVALPLQQVALRFSRVNFASNLAFV